VRCFDWFYATMWLCRAAIVAALAVALATVR